MNLKFTRGQQSSSFDSFSLHQLIWISLGSAVKVEIVETEQTTFPRVPFNFITQSWCYFFRWTRKCRICSILASSFHSTSPTFIDSVNRIYEVSQSVSQSFHCYFTRSLDTRAFSVFVFIIYCFIENSLNCQSHFRWTTCQPSSSHFLLHLRFSSACCCLRLTKIWEDFFLVSFFSILIFFCESRREENYWLNFPGLRDESFEFGSSRLLAQEKKIKK